MKSFTAAAVAALLANSATAKEGEKCEQQVCCGALSQAPGLEGKVFAPDTSVYDARLASYYSANAAQAPWCMVLPQSTQDVSEITKVFAEHKCPFGMRSGAHSAFEGSNGIKDGVTVDFGWLNATTYDTEKKLASTQPGSDWGHSFAALQEYGVVNVGGRASVVGVGGFSTGGGMSFHSSSQGFACDAVVNFEVVLADGSIVNANAHENSDLYRSLKGGSGNFGFVTRLDQRVVEQTKMWGGISTYSYDDRDDLFNAYLKFVENMSEDTASQNIVSTQYSSAGYALITVLSNVDAVENATAFDDYLAIPTETSTLRIGEIADLVPEFTGPTPLGLYAEWMTGMTTNDFRVMDFIERKHREYVDQMKAAAPDSDFNVLVQFQPVSESIVSHAQQYGGNVLGLEEVVADGPALMWLIAVTVDTAENQEKIHPISMEYKAAINAYADEIGAQKNWEFLNYSYKDQDPLSYYGAEAISHMQATSKKYDPTGMFQNQRRTGFKIPA